MRSPSTLACTCMYRETWAHRIRHCGYLYLPTDRSVVICPFSFQAPQTRK